MVVVTTVVPAGRVVYCSGRPIMGAMENLDERAEPHVQVEGDQRIEGDGRLDEPARVDGHEQPDGTKWQRGLAVVGRWLPALYLAAVGTATVQRGRLPYHHKTFPAFRDSFYHLMRGQNLYATNYVGPDLYKYSPTFALLFAPLALLPFTVGVLLWDALNAFLLYHVVGSLLPGEDGTVARLLLLPEVFAAVQASQSDALVCALILLAFLAAERGRVAGEAAAIGLGTAVKLFPLAGVTFALFHPRRLRFAAYLALAAVVLVLLPVVVVSPSALAAQYHQWRVLAQADAANRGSSVMGLLAWLVPGNWPNWPVQLAGTLILVAPLVRRARWRDADFRLLFLASLLVYAVIFNHRAERSSFVIAGAGAVVWWAVQRSPRPRWKLVLLLSCFVGLDAPPFIVLWGVIQAALWSPAQQPVTPPEARPSRIGQPLHPLPAPGRSSPS